MKYLIVFFFALLLLAVEPANATTTTPPKVVYLTFDADMTPFMKKELADGKVASWYDKSLVSYLEQQHIPATIFVTGMFAEMYGPLVKELAQHQGIVIGNHTYDHAGFESPCYKLRTLSTDKAKKNEITKTQEILTPLIGYTPKYFRYPGLCRNAHDDEIVRNLGLVVADNGIASGDAFNKHPKSIVHTVLNHIKDGSVIIMHLGGHNAPDTKIALQKIVPTLQSRGYVFRAL